jgi:hypothetical protein
MPRPTRESEQKPGRAIGDSPFGAKAGVLALARDTAPSPLAGGYGIPPTLDPVPRHEPMLEPMPFVLPREGAGKRIRLIRCLAV